MREPLSLLGWILIIFLVLLILSVNLSLFIGKKKPDNRDNWVSRIATAGKELKDPFHKDDEKLMELSTRVKHLNDKNPINHNDIENLGEQNED